MTATKLALNDLPQASDADIRPIVEAELARLKIHSLFKNTTRMKRFLEYVVKESLGGRESRLKGYTIGVEVFDRPDDFDPQTDTIVRVQAGQLRRRLDLYYSGDGKASPVRILMPKGRYAPVFEIRRPIEDVSQTQDSLVVAPIEPQGRPGVAVFTFQNLTTDNQHEYFAEGVTAEIVNALVQFRHIRVVSRTASVMARGQVTELADIAAKYNVQFVLTGNVRRSGSLMRVSVNLLATETGEHVYSKIFDRDYTPENLFDIQEEIASYIAASIAAPFGAMNRYNRRDNSGRKKSLPGYEAVLKYYDMSLSPSKSGARDLLLEFDEILEKTPRFSSAWAIKALLNIYFITQCVPPDNPQNRLKTALHSAKRAAAIDPENGLAYSAMFQSYYHAGEIDKAEKMAARALALNPNNYNMLSYYAITRAMQGDIPKALEFQKSAMSMLGRPPVWFYVAPMLCGFQNKEFEQVLEGIKDVKVSSIAPIQFFGLTCMGHLGKREQAMPFIEAALAHDSDYGNHALETFKYWQPNTKLLDLAVQGWRKVGLEISNYS